MATEMAMDVKAIVEDKLSSGSPIRSTAAHCFIKLVQSLRDAGLHYYVFEAIKLAEHNSLDYAKLFLHNHGEALARDIAARLYAPSGTYTKVSNARTALMAFYHMCHSFYGVSESAKRVLDSDDVKPFLTCTDTILL
jgi:hypothetical protein